MIPRYIVRPRCDTGPDGAPVSVPVRRDPSHDGLCVGLLHGPVRASCAPAWAAVPRNARHGTVADLSRGAAAKGEWVYAGWGFVQRALVTVEPLHDGDEALPATLPSPHHSPSHGAPHTPHGQSCASLRRDPTRAGTVSMSCVISDGTDCAHCDDAVLDVTLEWLPQELPSAHTSPSLPQPKAKPSSCGPEQLPAAADLVLLGSPGAHTPPLDPATLAPLTSAVVFAPNAARIGAGASGEVRLASLRPQAAATLPRPPTAHDPPLLPPQGPDECGRPPRAPLPGGVTLVAVKTLPLPPPHKELQRRHAVAELSASVAARHPNIVHCYGAFAAGDMSAALVMEYAGGGTLHSVVQDAGPLRAHEAIAVLRSLVAALEHLHGVMNFAHRDVKPENVLITETGGVRLADLGIARLLGADGAATCFTFCGSPLFMAPEVTSALQAVYGGAAGDVAAAEVKQLEKARLFDGRVDVYSLGVVLQFMLSGACTDALRAQWYLEGQPAPAAGKAGGKPPYRVPAKLCVPPSVVALVNALIASDPRLRPTTAQLKTLCFATTASPPAVAGMAGPTAAILHDALATPPDHRQSLSFAAALGTRGRTVAGLATTARAVAEGFATPEGTPKRKARARRPARPDDSAGPGAILVSPEPTPPRRQQLG